MTQSGPKNREYLINLAKNYDGKTTRSLTTLLVLFIGKYIESQAPFIHSGQ
jgi:hypothetical protein